MLRCTLFILCFILSCRTPPRLEMENARKAIDEATKLKAAQYAPNNFNEARAEYSKAEKQMEEKEYDKARKHAIKSREEAQKAYHEALQEFARETEELTQKAKEKADLANAAHLFPENYRQAMALEKELQEDIEKLKKLSEKLKKLEDEERAHKAKK
ncbi:MAG: DUF4398 domain-containing protein [Leptospiraceae bacterium]|nr:DUF4398 domain-containing protein [Leptospiraceae bacterium]MDW8306959.1 DUF4398 domain-containing protein [Leptospiraceae bacterium]